MTTPAPSPGGKHSAGVRRSFLFVALALLMLLWTVPFIGDALGAEPATIRVERCSGTGPEGNRSCGGSWTFDDGRTGSGGVGDIGDEGDVVRGWATDDEARASRLPWLLPPLLIGSALLVGVGAAVVVVGRLKLRERRRGQAPN